MTLLGKQTPTPERYAPELLFAIPRAEGRARLDLDASALPFRGEDVWHAWELSWQGPAGQPRSAVGRFVLPASSPYLIESKSFKLYLNSLNQSEFATELALTETLRQDLSAVAGGPVAVEILALDDPALVISELPGTCIDNCTLQQLADEPTASLLRVEKPAAQPAGQQAEQLLYSHSLRSLCPVTAQPDWATVLVRCAGSTVDPASLLTYLHSFRRHQEFHEQCVERMFCDLRQAGVQGAMSVQALYTRRGGLDINPWRSSERGSAPRLRSARQ